VNKKYLFRAFFINLYFITAFIGFSFAQEDILPLKPSGVNINADTVEYSTDNRNVLAVGNVRIVYKGTKLFCQKISVDTQTRDAVAEGKVRLEDAQGVIEAQKMTYNLDSGIGVIYDADFRANPYFGRSQKINRLSSVQMRALRTYLTTCNFDHPHYRIAAKKMDFLVGERVETKDNLFFFGQKAQIPILYLPSLTQSLKDPLMHVQVSPGIRKNWGAYLLTAWRHDLTANVTGNLLLDYRQKLGVAPGYLVNFDSLDFGKGDFKVYYTHERDNSNSISAADSNSSHEFERYLIRYRHKWDITDRTSMFAQYFKEKDTKRKLYGDKYDFLKDYFYREYEKDAQPSTYFSLRHVMDNSSLDLLVQKRINGWYSDLEKLPELKYTKVNTPIFADSPVYFENLSSLANYNKKVPDASVTGGFAYLDMARFDTYNQISVPFRFSIFKLAPFVGERITYYDKDVNGSSVSPRSIFYTGTDMSTKFYRLFNVKTNFLKLDINGLRHIISPTVSYNFNFKPTVSQSRLKQIDEIDALKLNNSASLELSNKLQTKRAGKSVDIADLRVRNTYTFRSSSNKEGGTLGDFLFDLDLLPYSWVSLSNETTLARDQHKLTDINTDLSFNFAPERSIGIGQRYHRKDSKDLTFSTQWRLTPKWKFSVYERFEFSNTAATGRGLREQEYSIIRDLHCWETELIYNTTKGNGQSIWIAFRLKAFPEMQFNLDQSYHQPKTGSQSLNN
jgi:hypothetical protein